MHIADGVLPVSSLAAGWAGTLALTGLTLRRVPQEDLPKAAVMTAGFFVASLVHVPLGPTSVHLLLNGLAGVVLGPAAFPAILVGLVLQTLMFQHGGLLTLGANAVMLGLPAIAAGWLFQWVRRLKLRRADALAGFVAGAVGILLSGIILALWLATAGQEFWTIARLALAAHLPLMVLEGLVCAAAAVFLMKVKPEILGGSFNAAEAARQNLPD
jgi:cobalt/nickel transport system permease protein